MSKGARKKSFREFQEDFYVAFENPQVFDCMEFNLLKVVQDGLKVQHSFSTQWGLPWIILLIFTRIHRWVARIRGIRSPFQEELFLPHKGRKYLLLDPGRCVKTKSNQWTSLYFHRLIQQIALQDQVFALERAGIDPLLSYDFTISSFARHAFFLPFTQEDRALYLALNQKFKEWHSNTQFSPLEFQYIKRALQLFWEQYRVWNWIFHQVCPSEAVFICHYHKEGLILALKRNGIKAIELQHGLIAAEDIFYVYPPPISSVASKALFADEIRTYGPYWRNVLLEGNEYSPEQIKVGGYYLFEKERDRTFIESIRNQAKEAPVLLVSTQKLLYQVFIDYVEWLVEDCHTKGIECLIIVKPHPGNPEGTYASLARHASVIVSRADLYDLFSASDLHLSIYSTTLYEATRLGLSNFSLYVESCSDYVERILSDGIANRLDWGENPFLQDAAQASSIAPEHLFAPFSFSNPNTILS
ncbi:MAG: hypothetical protein AAF399_11530 [Bacteroidota bacterium]